MLFNKKGISSKNLENVIGKIRKAIFLWDIPSLNMLERITIVKTFLLSKLWFITTFIKINLQKIKEINLLVFRFIWNSKIELVKRETLILPYENGGMNMFHLESRLKTVSLQTYLYIRKNYNRDFYQLSIKWLKFHLRDLGLKNFNLIPFGDDKEIPKVYHYMIECQNEFKNYDKIFFKKNYTSKKTYEFYRKPYEIKSKREAEYKNINWVEVYNKINNKSLGSNLRVLNYKIFNEALNLNIKLSSKLGEQCVFCERHTETRDHLFVECLFTKKMFENISQKLRNKKVFNKLDLILNLNVDDRDVKIISIFKMSIWSLRNLIKKERKKNCEKEIIFKKILNRNFNS